MFSKLQYRNMTTVLTREYLDSRPKGWEDYAPQRIAQLYGSENIFPSVIISHKCIEVYVHLFMFVFVHIGKQKNATTRLLVRNTLIWFYRPSLLSTPGNFTSVQLLETQEIFWRLSLERRLIVMMLLYETMKLLLMR